MHIPLTPMTLLERSAYAFPKSSAVVDSQGSLNFSELLLRCRKLAGVLLSLNVQQGDRVAILADNSRYVIESHFGVPGSGAVLVMLNPWLNETDLLDLMALSEAKILISGIDIYQNLSEVTRSKLLKQAKIILASADRNAVLSSCLDYETCLENKKGYINLEQAVTSEDSHLAINFTSGTTGGAKGVVYSHRAGYLHSLGQVMMLGLTRQSCYLWTLPMFHVNGWGHIWACVASGCQQIVPKWHLDGEHIEAFEEYIQTFCITHMAGAPRLIRFITAAQSNVVHGLTVMTGGSAPQPVLAKQLEEQGVNLIHQYGLSETLGPFIVSEPQEYWASLDTEKRALHYARQGVPALHAGTGVCVVGRDGSAVPHDGHTLGEIIMRGNTLAIGYFRNPEATSKAFRKGWFYSGDMAVVYPDGSLEIRDRAKDLIYVETPYGWENISSIEIERVLCRHPEVQDAAIINIEHPNNNNTLLVAFLEIKNGRCPNETEFHQYCDTSLNSYQRPNIIIFKLLPKTHTGKVRKDQLRKIAFQYVEKSFFRD